MNMFTATKLQATTYLFGVCLFSVCTFDTVLAPYLLPELTIHIGPICRKMVIDHRSLIDCIPSISKLVYLVRHHESHRTKD